MALFTSFPTNNRDVWVMSPGAMGRELVGAGTIRLLKAIGGRGKGKRVRPQETGGVAAGRSVD